MLRRWSDGASGDARRQCRLRAGPEYGRRKENPGRNQGRRRSLDCIFRWNSCTLGRRAPSEVGEAIAESSPSTGRARRSRTRDRRAWRGPAPERAVLSVRLLATEHDIEETLPLALAAHAESRHREYRFDAERRRRFLAERFLADPKRYGFLVARHGGRTVGMLTCHAQTLYYSDVTVASCLSLYVLGPVPAHAARGAGGAAAARCGPALGAEPQSGRVAHPRDERHPHRAHRRGASPGGVSPDGWELRDGVRRGGGSMNAGRMRAVRGALVGWMRPSVAKVGAVQIGNRSHRGGGAVHGGGVALVGGGGARVLLLRVRRVTRWGITGTSRTARSPHRDGRR